MTTTPGMAETLARDWRKAAWFYARFGITEARFRTGIPADAMEAIDNPPIGPNMLQGETRT